MNDDGRNIVPAPARERDIDQSFRRPLAIPRSKLAEHLLLGDLITEPIAAKQERIAIVERDGIFIELKRIHRTDRARDQMLCRMMQRFLSGNLPTRLELFDMTMIARQLTQTPVAAKIDAAIPSPQVSAETLARHQQHDRASDALNLSLGRLETKLPIHPHEPVARIGDEARKPVRRRHARQTLDDKTASEIADRVPAHAVGNGPDAQIGLIKERVLVDVPHAPSIRASGRRPSKLSGKGHDNLSDLQ
jgi:hypothetical protein